MKRKKIETERKTQRFELTSSEWETNKQKEGTNRKRKKNHWNVEFLSISSDFFIVSIAFHRIQAKVNTNLKRISLNVAALNNAKFKINIYNNATIQDG